MRRFPWITFLLLSIIGGIGGFFLYQIIFGYKTVNTPNSKILYIQTGDSLENVVNNLEKNNFVAHPSEFEWLANRMKYGAASKIKPGKYQIESGISYKKLIAKLRRGDQTPVQITIPVVRRLEKLATIIGSKLEVDSARLISDFLAHDAEKSHIIQPFLSKVIPNTYEILWNTDSHQLTQRLLKEYEVFWDLKNRKQKAQSLGLSQDEVYTLASIVERETNYGPERPTIAGVYLNRLKRGIALQADPSVVFALNDYSIRRVLNRYLTIDSPYNTYKYPGLPPGPIGVSSPNSIDAVLNAETHDYLYFCAEPENKGTHAFATSLMQHNRNANKFRSWLDSQGIRR